MASGSYAYRARQISMRQQGATFAGTQPSRVPAIVHRSFWLKPWMLYPIGATCVLTVLLSTGIVSQHPVSSSSIVTFGGQTYDIQVGGDMASTWQQDHPASIPTPTQEPMAQYHSNTKNDFVDGLERERRTVARRLHEQDNGIGERLVRLGNELMLRPSSRELGAAALDDTRIAA